MKKVDNLEIHLVEERKIFSSKNIIMREQETELKLLSLKEVRSKIHDLILGKTYFAAESYTPKTYLGRIQG